MNKAYSFRGFSESELRAAFRLVAPADDWKRPIQARIAGEDIRVVLAAITFFTGGEGFPAFAPDPAGGARTWVVTAPGYYASTREAR